MAEKEIEQFGEIFICPEMKNHEGEHREIFLHNNQLFPHYSVFKMIIREKDRSVIESASVKTAK